MKNIVLGRNGHIPLYRQSNNDMRKEMGSIKHTKGMDGMEQQWQTGDHKGNNDIKQCRVMENIF